MKTADLLVLAVAGLVGFIIYKKLSLPQQAPTPATLTSAPIGGVQQISPQSDVAAIAGSIGKFFDLAGAIAQTAPKTH